MLAVVFALISATGAWLAWRRNPLYSTRSTLRTVAFAGLAIGAVIALIVATVTLTINRPAAVAMSALGAVIIASTLALIFIIQAVSTPKDARLTTALPASAQMQQLHRRTVYGWAKLFAAVLAALAVLALVVPGDGRYAVLAVGGIGLFLALILLPTLYLNARTLDRSLTALESGPWVHWNYPASQWQSWTDARVERLRSTATNVDLPRIWRTLAVAMLGIVVGVGAFAPGTWLEKGAYLAFLAVAFGAVVLVSARAGRTAPARLRVRLGRVAPEAYLGHDGLFCDGTYTPWLGIGEYLSSATIDVRPPRSLVFNFDKAMVSPYSIGRSVPVQFCVPIPAAGDADVARLQQELSARCPKARIAFA
jgi:hypothetical protein